MQDIGLSDIQVTTFLQHCITFLDIFLDVSMMGDACKKIDERDTSNYTASRTVCILRLSHVSESPLFYVYVGRGTRARGQRDGQVGGIVGGTPRWAAAVRHVGHLSDASLVRVGFAARTSG